MYSVGSLFYAIYFFVSFPMFFRIGEAWPARGRAVHRCTAGCALLDSMACCMLVTLLLDFWRLAIGTIAGGDSAGAVPWLG